MQGKTAVGMGIGLQQIQGGQQIGDVTGRGGVLTTKDTNHTKESPGGIIPKVLITLRRDVEPWPNVLITLRRDVEPWPKVLITLRRDDEP